MPMVTDPVTGAEWWEPEPPKPSWGGVQYGVDELGAEGVIAGTEASAENLTLAEAAIRETSPYLYQAYQQGKQAGDFTRFNAAAENYNQIQEYKKRNPTEEAIRLGFDKVKRENNLPENARLTGYDAEKAEYSYVIPPKAITGEEALSQLKRDRKIDAEARLIAYNPDTGEVQYQNPIAVFPDSMILLNGSEFKSRVRQYISNNLGRATMKELQDKAELVVSGEMRKEGKVVNTPQFTSMPAIVANYKSTLTPEERKAYDAWAVSRNKELSESLRAQAISFVPIAGTVFNWNSMKGHALQKTISIASDALVVLPLIGSSARGISMLTKGVPQAMWEAQAARSEMNKAIGLLKGRELGRIGYTPLQATLQQGAQEAIARSAKADAVLLDKFAALKQVTHGELEQFSRYLNKPGLKSAVMDVQRTADNLGKQWAKVGGIEKGVVSEATAEGVKLSDFPFEYTRAVLPSKITPQQINRIQAAKDQLDRALSRLDKVIGPTRSQRFDELTQGIVDTSRRQVATRKDLFNDIKSFLNKDKPLTPEQRAKLDEILERQRNEPKPWESRGGTAVKEKPAAVEVKPKVEAKQSVKGITEVKPEVKSTLPKVKPDASVMPGIVTKIATSTPDKVIYETPDMQRERIKREAEAGTVQESVTSTRIGEQPSTGIAPITTTGKAPYQSPEQEFEPAPETQPEPDTTTKTRTDTDTGIPPKNPKAVRTPRYPATFKNDKPTENARKLEALAMERDVIAWPQGELKGGRVYHYIIGPYNKPRHLVIVGTPPTNVTVFPGPGQAYRHIVQVSGNPPKNPIKAEGGAVDPVISSYMGKVKISFVPDRKRYKKFRKQEPVDRSDIAPGVVEDKRGRHII